MTKPKTGREAEKPDIASSSAERDVSGSYASLVEALTNQFDTPLDALPEALRKRVDSEFPMPWDKLSSNLRRSLAVELDALHAPLDADTPQARQAFLLGKLALQERIKNWESVETPTASDLGLKETQLSTLRTELAAIEQEERVARGDFFDPKGAKSQTKAPGHLDHDPALQAKANQIAQERMVELRRPVTKGEVANILAKETGQNPSTVERRLRKQWRYRSLPNCLKPPK